MNNTSHAIESIRQGRRFRLKFKFKIRRTGKSTCLEVCMSASLVVTQEVCMSGSEQVYKSASLQ